MKIALIGYGGGGVRIAERFKRIERLSAQHITEEILTFDTSEYSFHDISRIPDQNQIPIAMNNLDGRGTGKDVDKGSKYTSLYMTGIMSKFKNVKDDEIDAILIVHTLGGGTGGGGTPQLIEKLVEEYDSPVYTASILPAKNDPRLMEVNAAKSIQSIAKHAHNTILFDNHQLGATWPDAEGHPDIYNNNDYNTANNAIASALHLFFSADESKQSDRLEGSLIEKDELLQTLNVGGFSTISVNKRYIPRPARPGLFNRLFELYERMKITHRKNLEEQRRKRTNKGENWQTLATPEDNTDENPEPNTEETAIVPYTGEENENPYEQDWPHPVDVVPETLTQEHTMIGHDPRDAARHLTILAGPPRVMTPQAPIDVANWISKNTESGNVACGNYVRNHKNVTALTFASDIGIPFRINALQERAEFVMNRVEQAKEAENKRDPSNYNPLEGLDNSLEAIN